MKKTKLTVAELQASRKTLEQDIAVLAARTDEVSKAKLEAKKAQLEANDSQIELAEQAALEATRQATAADAALDAMVAQGDLAAKDATRRAELKAAFCGENGDSVMKQVAGPALAKQAGGALSAKGGAPGAALIATGRIAPVAGALTAVDGRINRFGIECGASYSYEFLNGFSAKEALAGYAELMAANETCGWRINDHISQSKKHDLAIEAGNWYKAHLRPNHSKWEDIPGWQLQKMVKQDQGLSAADYTSGTLGTLQGTLVLQRTLPTFAYKYPELLSMYTDFSDTPGVYNQTEMTRIVVQPSVQTYDPTLTNGIPAGWTAANDGTGTTIDVPITLTDFVGAPIVVNNAVLAATTRRLFDEQSSLAIKGIAGYFTQMATNLMTMANFNAYATAGTNATYGGTVPNVYASYPANSSTFSLSDMDKIHAAFSSMKVPAEDRGVLLNPTFYSALRRDPRFYFLFMGAAKSIGSPGDYLSEPLLPRISGFAPYEAAYMPTSIPATNPTTSNVAGFAYHKAAIILKSRLPQDFIQALGVMVPGSVTTITDPDTKISIMLVQFVDLLKEFAMWRPEIILGAAKGDFRGGMVIQGT
jgi:hypothetical protein